MRDADDHPFQSLCHEAVLACGPNDLEAIRRYVDARLAAMSEAGRQHVAGDIERVLAFMPLDHSNWVQ